MNNSETLATLSTEGTRRRQKTQNEHNSGDEPMCSQKSFLFLHPIRHPSYLLLIPVYQSSYVYFTSSNQNWSTLYFYMLHVLTRTVTYFFVNSPITIIVKTITYWHTTGNTWLQNKLERVIQCIISKPNTVRNRQVFGLTRMHLLKGSDNRVRLNCSDNTRFRFIYGSYKTGCILILVWWIY